MGCDIHGFIEVRSKNSPEWLPFAKLYLRRNYDLFARLAGVRGPSDAAVVAPRGLPEDASSRTRGECTLFIVYSHVPEPGGQSIGFDEAAKWVSQGKSQFVGKVRKAIVTFTPHFGLPETRVVNAETEGQPSHITDPDFHSFTWLSPEEFDKAVAGIAHLSADYVAVSSAMQKLQEGSHQVRLVLWFDN